jgi:hypothetical protein
VFQKDFEKDKLMMRNDVFLDWKVEATKGNIVWQVKSFLVII